MGHCPEEFVGGEVVRMRKSAVWLLLVLSVGAAHFAKAQDENDAAKAEALIREAVRLRGGDAYLKVRSVIGRGTFTAFEKGEAGLPAEFVDYIVYPDRERTEFGKGDHKFIQTNAGDSGWVYDAAQKMIRDQKEDQIKS